ncbi:MAG TPA: protein phosphatase CheZ [Xanthobacteraceae bacterium]|jgi:chemotaxis protein CheZ|nr:protein phosphatase CheZ [Xanthobacteraceae bacterium]
MPVQRQVFSIERYAQREGLQTERAPANDAARGRQMPADPNELRLVQEALNRIRNDMAGFGRRLAGDERMARANRELQAIVTETQHATHTILQAAETIDGAANTLSAALKSSHEQELAQDIRDSVIRILEACNFQDLTGQHITHVAATLTFIEQQLAKMMGACDGMPWQGGGAEANDESRERFLHGPRLAGDKGHATQAEIDRIFRRA